MMISVIMQSYLGDYPGSRSNPEQKFIRAVESFLGQTYQDSELIIVSDGCDITHRLYMENYRYNSRIKYIYIDRQGDRMYQSDSEKTSFTGIPRQMGIGLASGKIIAYLDTDDAIIPQHLEIIHTVWQDHAEDKVWAINNSWLDHVSRAETSIDADLFEEPNLDKKVTIKGIEGEWYPSRVKNGSVCMETVGLSHLKRCSTEWHDTKGQYEDFDFVYRLMQDHPDGMTYYAPTYIRCHYPNLWDL